MLKVKITDGMRSEAERHHRVMSKRFQNGGNYTGVEDASRWYVGKMGELAFWYVMLHGGYRHVYEVADRPDEQDFIVYHDGKKITIDVKSTNGLQTQIFGTPAKRYDKDYHDVYVGVRVGDDHCEIVGYLKHNEMKYLDPAEQPLKRFGFSKAHRGDLYDNIKPINKLLDKLDKGEQSPWAN